MKPDVLILAGKNAVLEVYGVPVLRRLVMVAKKSGAGDIFCLYHPRHRESIGVISDLVPDSHCASFAEFVNGFEKLAGVWFKEDRDLIISWGNLVIDRLSLSNLINYRSDKPVLLENPGGGQNSPWMSKLPAVTFTTPRGLKNIVEKAFFSDTLPDNIVEKSTVIYASPGLPYPVTEALDSVAEAEKRLLGTLGLQTAATDGFMARNFDRNISRFFSRRLVSTGLHPNWFTFFGMSIGLVGAWFLSRPDYIHRLLGSLLFLFCIMVDGVDGEIARLTLKDSTFGHYLDIITDNVVHAAVFLALPLGFYRETGNPLYLKCLWFLILGVAFAAFSAYYCIFRLEERYNRKTLEIFDKLASRDFAYLVAVLAVFNKLEWFLWGATVGSYVFGVVLWIIYFRFSPLTRGCSRV